MGAKGKISILVMREDAGVKRLKVSPGFLRFLIWLFILFLAAAGLAGYASYYYWERSAAQAAENARLKEDADASKDKLVKLASLEGILKDGDQTELKTLLASYNADAAERLECPKEETPPLPAPVAGAGAGAEQGKDAPECPKPDLRAIFDKVDLNLAGVDNFKASLDNKRVNVSFDLSNVTPQTALSGDAECQLLTNGGELLPLKAKREDLNFQIQRFKQVSTTTAMPPKVEPADVYGVRMLLKDPEGKIIFSNVYPLPKS